MNKEEIIFRASSVGKIMTNDRSGKQMGETAKTYLKQYYRELKYKRRKDISNKYIEKGLAQEEAGIDLLSISLNKLLKKNDQRLTNHYVTGEPDCYIGETILRATEGYDIKCSWDLFTLPYKDDKLLSDYYYQAHSYMWLTGALKWNIAYCLVNTPLHLIQKEKERIYYSLNCPAEDNQEYIKKCIEVEKNNIFDSFEFYKEYPGYDLQCKEWSFDIPKEERVVMFEVERDEAIIELMITRIEEARNYLLTLNQ